LLRLVLDLSYNLLYNKLTTHPQQIESQQQVACNNQQVLQHVAQLVVQQIHS